MAAFIGIVLLIASVAGGYLLHGGRLLVLFQLSEILILFGAAVSYVVIAGGLELSGRLVRQVLWPPRAPDRERYLELLQAFSGLLWMSTRSGVRGVETHVEAPGHSAFFRRFPGLMADGAALALLADTLKLAISGQADPARIDEMMEADIEQQYEYEMAPVRLANKVADAMPAFGIVAAVLGVIISMGHIGGEPSLVGQSIAAALVGTFLGVLLAYGLFAPLAHSLEERVEARQAFLNCIRTGVLSFARRDPPSVAVEYVRRTIQPGCRPDFASVERIARNGRQLVGLEPAPAEVPGVVEPARASA